MMENRAFFPNKRQTFKPLKTAHEPNVLLRFSQNVMRGGVQREVSLHNRF
jgi:hypothetical protein